MQKTKATDRDNPQSVKPIPKTSFMQFQKLSVYKEKTKQNKTQNKLKHTFKLNGTNLCFLLFLSLIYLSIFPLYLPYPHPKKILGIFFSWKSASCLLQKPVVQGMLCH